MLYESDERACLCKTWWISANHNLIGASYSFHVEPLCGSLLSLAWEIYVYVENVIKSKENKINLVRNVQNFKNGIHLPEYLINLSVKFGSSLLSTLP
jgi:hypothetical protein